MVCEGKSVDGFHVNDENPNEMLRIDNFIHSRSSHMVQNHFLGAQTHYKPTGNLQISFSDDLGVENCIYKVRQEFYYQNAVPPIQLLQVRVIHWAIHYFLIWQRTELIHINLGTLQEKDN